jgi:hypothetical protein
MLFANEEQTQLRLIHKRPKWTIDDSGTGRIPESLEDEDHWEDIEQLVPLIQTS